MTAGIIFDKDGTLFDFNATWGAWSAGMIATEAGGDPELTQKLADVLGYDIENKVFRPGSLVIASTALELAEAILTVVPGDRNALLARMNKHAGEVGQVAAADLPVVMATLKAMNLRLGVATNDSEGPARLHLDRAGITDAFDFIAGYDSGYGGKPAPGQLHAFCKATGLTPDTCVMVGDSTHDLHAGRAAGMHTVGVLTGPAPAEELAPFADEVLHSVADLPAWIAEMRK